MRKKEEQEEEEEEEEEEEKTQNKQIKRNKSEEEGKEQQQEQHVPFAIKQKICQWQNINIDLHNIYILYVCTVYQYINLRISKI